MEKEAESWEMEPGELFQQLRGRVFHTLKRVGSKDYMHRYRIGTDGKFTLEERLLGAYLSGKEVQNIIKEAGNEVRFLINNVFARTFSKAKFNLYVIRSLELYQTLNLCKIIFSTNRGIL